MPNFNAFMHRRNIFRKEPDFKNLVCEYRELDQYMTKNSKNKPKFDFKNPDALRALTCALLHKYFQKRITIPTNRLIPAVPQRLNYICWVEDLVNLLSINYVGDLNVKGLDIGTGASCIFPILSCHKNPNWTFVGVEADVMSYNVAKENVQKNFMTDRIQVIKVSPENTLSDILCLTASPITLLMCNPPFFEEEYGVKLEMQPNISHASSNHPGRRPKSGANCSDKVESVCSGGEIAFVGRLLEESLHFREEVTIYTSMLGRKQSLTHFKQTLSSMDDLTWTWAELCQGKTIRYAIAWSFYPGLDLTRAPPLRHGKNKSWKVKLQRRMPKRDCQLEMLDNISFLRDLVSRELMVNQARVSRQTGRNFEMLIKTNERTWMHQRKKKRDRQFNRHKYQATPTTINASQSNPALARASDVIVTSPSFLNPKKRKNPSTCSSSPSRVCPSPNDELTDDDNQSMDDSDDIHTQTEDSMNESPMEVKRICIDKQDDSENMDDIYDYLLCCRISLSRVCHDVYFELKLEHPCTAANDAYDLFQYFRNKLAEI